MSIIKDPCKELLDHIILRRVHDVIPELVVRDILHKNDYGKLSLKFINNSKIDSDRLTLEFIQHLKDVYTAAIFNKETVLNEVIKKNQQGQQQQDAGNKENDEFLSVFVNKFKNNPPEFEVVGYKDKDKV
jgi:hypothetical protein